MDSIFFSEDSVLFVAAIFEHVMLCPSPQRRYFRACGAMREETSVQDDLFVALVFGIIFNTGVIQPSYQFRQAFTSCTRRLNLNVSCCPGRDSHIAFLQAPQGGLFHFGGTRCKCSRLSTRQLSGGTCDVCTCICFVQSNTGVSNLHAHPLAITVVDTQLVPQSYGTAFSLCT